MKHQTSNVHFSHSVANRSLSFTIFFHSKLPDRGHYQCNKYVNIVTMMVSKLIYETSNLDAARGSRIEGLTD